MRCDTGAGEMGSKEMRVSHLGGASGAAPLAGGDGKTTIWGPGFVAANVPLACSSSSCSSPFPQPALPAPAPRLPTESRAYKTCSSAAARSQLQASPRGFSCAFLGPNLREKESACCGRCRAVLCVAVCARGAAGAPFSLSNCGRRTGRTAGRGICWGGRRAGPGGGCR